MSVYFGVRELKVPTGSIKNHHVSMWLCCLKYFESSEPKSFKSMQLRVLKCLGWDNFNLQVTSDRCGKLSSLNRFVCKILKLLCQNGKVDSWKSHKQYSAGVEFSLLVWSPLTVTRTSWFWCFATAVQDYNFVVLYYDMKTF